MLIAVGTMAGFALHQHSHRPMHDLGTPAPVTGPLELIHAATAGAPFVNGIAMKFVPVPIFGVPATGTPVPVKVLFATTETTVAQYERFVVATKRDSPKPDFAQAPDHPAVNVSWEDAQAFCAWLTESELASKRLPPGAKYRLPTDHEWSCAVGIGDREDASRSPKVKRGAIEGVYPWGTRWPPPQGSGNYADEAAKKAGVGTVHIDNYDDGFDHTCPVEAFAPNALGIFGLGGNAAEWCEDWYDPAKKEVRTLRGGSWADGDELYLRSSFRAGAAPDERFVGYGFRCVLEALGPTDAPRENP